MMLYVHSTTFTLYGQTNLPSQETSTFAWRLNEEDFVRYEVTFQCSGDFWCFLFHLTKPLPHN